MNLRAARPDEVDSFIQLLEDSALWMHRRGIVQWSRGSMMAQRPALERAQVDDELLVIESGGRLSGGVVLSMRPDPIWADRPITGACYLSKLVVARDQNGLRLGEQILSACEDIARARGCEFVRLDCVASNESLGRYYQRRGYYPRGVVVSRGVRLLRHDRRISLPRVPAEPFGANRFATLMFVEHEGQVLLIRKKRGHGAGKINGPGGMVEVGETALQCVLRETVEEVGVFVHDATPLAELRFRDSDGSRMLGIAFRARAWEGEPKETAEAAPFWCPTTALPYESMWEDDILWLPWLLQDMPVVGHFVFCGDHLVQHRLDPSTHMELLRIANETVAQ